VDELIKNTHVVNIDEKGKRRYSLANLLYATVLHFYNFFFITSPSSENQHKEKAAIV